MPELTPSTSGRGTTGIRFLLPIILFSALALRVGCGLARPPQAPGAAISDPDGYVELATSFSHDWSLSKRGKLNADREPVYPVLLGMTFKVFGRSYATVLLLNSMATVAAIALLFFAAGPIVGERAALLACAIAAFYPSSLYYSGQCLREAAMSFAAVAVVAAALAAERRRTWGSAAAAGLAGGLAGLLNTTFVPFVGLAAALHVLLGRSRAALGRAALYVAAAFLIYIPWPIRNIAVFHQPIIGSTAGAGSTFYTYLIVPQEIGGTPQQAEIQSADPVLAQGSKMDPVSGERYYWREGLKRVKGDPIAFTRLVAWRFFWDEWRLLPRERSYGHSYALVKWGSVLSDGWIIPFGLAGLALALARSREALYPAAFVLGFAFTYSLVFTMIRYRFSLMPWLILFAAYAVDEAAQAVRTRRAR